MTIEAPKQRKQPKQRRGFAAMDPAKARAICSMGGKVAHERGAAHEFSSNEAREAGRLGGLAILASRGSAYFAALGRKGGARRAANRRSRAEKDSV